MAGCRPAELAGELAAHGLAPRTVYRYRNIISAADRWCVDEGLDLDTLSGPNLARYAESTPLSFSTRSAIRAALDHYWQVVDRTSPPLRAIRVPPQPIGACRAIEAGDARILAKAARCRGDRKGLAVALGLYEGMRCAEIAGCRWEWFHERGWLHVTGKGAKTRRIPIHPAVSLLVGEHPRSGWVFPGLKQTHVCPATVWGWVRRVCLDAGVPVISPHVLRHTCLATSNDNTGDLRAVQALAGHSKPETTSRYTRATATRLQAAVDALDY